MFSANCFFDFGNYRLELLEIYISSFVKYTTQTPLECSLHRYFDTNGNNGVTSTQHSLSQKHSPLTLEKKAKPKQQVSKHSKKMTNPSISMEKKRKLSIPELPTHIIFEILTRLPVKALLNCQLVCTDWLYLIFDSHFAKTHLSNSPLSLLMKPTHHDWRELQLIDVSLLTLRNSDPAEAKLVFYSQMHYPLSGERVVNSCNGLICSKDVSDPVFITNPILGEYISIPLACHVGKYDGTTSAIGFSPLTNKYKVIQFFLKRVSFKPIINDEEAEAEIYTLGEGPWRSLGRVPYHLSKHSFNSSVNGALHWLNFTPDSPDFIRCFDFGSEQFRVVPEPPEFGLGKKALPNRMTVGVLRDSLAVCDFSSLHVEIWIMKHYNIRESWCKEFVIKKVLVKRQYLSYCEPIKILKGGEILMWVNKNALVQYNPKLGIFKDLQIYGIKSEIYATAHIPSFVSPADVAKGERFTVCYKRKRSKILDRMWKRLKGQSSGWTAHKQLQVHGYPKDPLGEECLLKLKMLQRDPYAKMILATRDNMKEFTGLPSDEIRLAWLKEKLRCNEADGKADQRLNLWSYENWGVLAEVD